MNIEIKVFNSLNEYLYIFFYKIQYIKNKTQNRVSHTHKLLINECIQKRFHKERKATIK